MGSARDIVLRPLGLITRPNKYGQVPPGAMSVCKNVALRDSGVASSLPDTRELCASAAAGAVKAMIAIDTDRVLVAHATGAALVDGAVTTPVTVPVELTGTTWTHDTVSGTTRFARMRGRTFLASDQGVVVFDDDVSFTAPRLAGIPRPMVYSTGLAADGTSLAPQRRRRYISVIRRTVSAGYELSSEPSTAVEVINQTTATTYNPYQVWVWTNDAGYKAGDWIEWYRTDDSPLGVDPGDTYRLAGVRRLENADFNNGIGTEGGNASLLDASVDDGLGDELYTNIEGDDQINSPPPLAYDLCAFAGHMLYVSRNLIPSYRFAPKAVLGTIVTGYTLTTAAERANGIGRRRVTGDATAGSPTIINVSAADMVGVVVGQLVNIGTYPTRIIAVTASTFTASKNSSSTGTFTYSIDDVIEDGPSASQLFALSATGPEVDGLFINLRADWPLVLYREKPIVRQTNTPVYPSIDGGTPIVMRALRYGNGTFTIRATNGQNYTPELPEANGGTADAATLDTRTNRIHWSKVDKPEAVPPSNYFTVGAGEIHRIAATRDCVYVFCSDGLYRLSGLGPDWRVDPVDKSLVLVDRLALAVMDDVVYALTNRGLVAVSTEVVPLSRDRIDLGVDGVAIGDGHAASYVLEADPKHREVWVTTTSGGVTSTTIYNAGTNAFYTMEDGQVISRLCYSDGLGSIVYSNSDAQPDLRYFYGDSATARMASADVRFQPVTGGGDVFGLKEFIDVDYILEGFSSAATIVPSFGGTNYSSRSVPTSSVESRCRVAVPRAAPALAPRLTPGFTFSSGATSQNWSLRGVAVRYRNAGPEGGNR